jgi:hypothetical protein
MDRLRGDVGAAGWGFPDQDAWLGLFKLPAFGLFALMVMTT